jgi:hypothetical protein
MIRLSLSFLVLAILVQTADSQQPKKVKIEGYVYDAARMGIAGVDVTVWVAGRGDTIAGTRTNQDGKYGLEVMVTDSFDIAYTKSKYNLSVVTPSSKKNDQQISRVLYLKGDKMPATAAHTFVQSINRVSFLASTIPKKMRKDFFAKFPDLGDERLPSDHAKLFIVVEASAETNELISAEWQNSANSLNKLIFGK